MTTPDALAPATEALPDRHRPRYHFSARRGWINDPNGIAWHAGRWHVFYQHNPLAPRWGGICWGHASSADLIHWHDEPVALRPTPGHDQHGCFSGSFAQVEGVPTLFYSGDNGRGQVQCAATSTDLVSWTKHPERTIVQPPEGVASSAFRDPFVFRHGGAWYMAVGASLQGQRGQVLLYRSADGLAWQYLHPLFTAATLLDGVMWECPCFVPLGTPEDGRWALTVSVWPNLGARWWVGRFDDERFVPEADGVLDPDGGAFAHLAAGGPDGRTLQWSWLDEQRAQPALDAAGWAGALSVPRELALDDHPRLLARPAAEIAHLRGATVAQANLAGGKGTLLRFAGRCLDIEARFAPREPRKLGLTLLASADGREQTRIVWWPDARRLVIERERSSLDRDTRHQNVQVTLLLDDGEPLNLRVLLDHSVLEVYANDRLTLSTRVYPSLDDSDQAWAWSEGDCALRLSAWAMQPITPLRNDAPEAD